MSRPCEMPLRCHVCGSDNIYKADSVPSAEDSPSPHEIAYRWRPYCFAHAMERKEVATNRLSEIVICEQQGLARVDRGRSSGFCICPDCNRDYFRHLPDLDHPFLRVLCDGSAVKL